MDLLKTFGPLLQQVAPTIATALGGPVAGIAVRALSTALLGNESGTVDDVSAALSVATPEQIAAIKKVENDFKVQMKALDIDLVKISQADRASAREMQMAVKSQLVPTLAVVIVGSFIGVTVGTLLGYTKIDSVLAGTLVGYLSAKAEQVIAFYFGSSNGSRAKDLMLFNSSSRR